MSLAPQERAYYEALVDIADEFGPFDQGSSGIWVGYESASENKVANIGVKCGNCAFHYDKAEGALGCKLLSFEIEENAKCRLAAIPDGIIDVEMDDDMDNMGKADSVRVGQMVSWSSSGGRATGKVQRIIRNGNYSVPNSSFTISGTPDNPAVVIRLYRDGKPTDTIVAHKMKTLTGMSKIIDNHGLELLFKNMPTHAKKTWR